MALLRILLDEYVFFSTPPGRRRGSAPGGAGAVGEPRSNRDLPQSAGTAAGQRGALGAETARNLLELEGSASCAGA